ncbi:MAG: sugar kinase [Coprococcus comes]|nr:sugar kinase [Coprococcus comes]
MSEVILFGEPMAMFVAKSCGPLHEVEEFTRMLAGAEVNVAIGLKRLGHSVAYVTKLGTDPFGTYIENKLKAEGLDVQITKDENHFTGYQLKGKVLEGDPEVFYYRRNSAASCLSVEDIEKVDLEGARVLHITGIPAALSKSCREATYRLIERAREKDMLVSFDPNLRPTLWESEEVMIQTINDIASKADIVLPGTGEGKILMGSEKPEEIAEFYRKNGAKAVIIKTGGDGAYADWEGGKAFYPGYKVKEVVDTVGAGDGFAVGILSAWLEGEKMPEMVDRGNAIGSIQVSVASDNEGLPTKEELDAYMKGAK